MALLSLATGTHALCMDCRGSGQHGQCDRCNGRGVTCPTCRGMRFVIQRPKRRHDEHMRWGDDSEHSQFGLTACPDCRTAQDEAVCIKRYIALSDER